MAVLEGAFVREVSRFRRWVTPGDDGEFPAAAGRYHLYVALGCPWSHRAVILRRLKGLEDAVSVSWIDPYRDERGWRFSGGRFVDEVNGFAFLSEAYERTEPGYDGRISSPVLWDKQTGQVVSNESADIVRMFGSAFDDVAGEPGLDLYPEPLRHEIDALNERVYETVNNGVYCAGFAKTQAAYEDAFFALFESLAELDDLLGERRYLAGDAITEADWRLFPTLVRFDPVYHLHFRCNGRRLVDHPNLWAYARELHQWPGIAETVAMDEIKRHYYTTHDSLNPKRIIPAGPLDLDWDAPHGRG
ncbi:MAG TPA: glutathione S-transferase family protein [Solirubrobacteraceae bacterium]|nr:glutathione S-transferase family protein [Solirubrobacteraceae bacterium]